MTETLKKPRKWRRRQQTANVMPIRDRRRLTLPPTWVPGTRNRGCRPLAMRATVNRGGGRPVGRSMTRGNAVKCTFKGGIACRRGLVATRHASAVRGESRLAHADEAAVVFAGQRPQEGAHVRAFVAEADRIAAQLRLGL